jgi:hypothetical protein
MLVGSVAKKKPLVRAFLEDGDKLIDVLDFIVDNPKLAPRGAARKMKIGMDRWYRLLQLLVDMDLVFAPGDSRKTPRRAYGLTRRGRALLGRVDALEALLDTSPMGLSVRASEGSLRRGSAEAGAVLCELIDAAAMRADARGLLEMQCQAARLGRWGEVALADAVECLLRGRVDSGLQALGHAELRLRGEHTHPSYRRLLLVRSAAFMERGEDRAAFRWAVEAQAAASRAADRRGESEARAIRGLAKLRMGRVVDAIKEVRMAAKLAGRLESEDVAANVWVTMGLAQIQSWPREADDLVAAVATIAQERAIPLLHARCRVQMAASRAMAGLQHDALEQARIAEREVLALGNAWRIGSGGWASRLSRHLNGVGAMGPNEAMAHLAAWALPPPLYLGLPQGARGSSTRVRPSPARHRRPRTGEAGGPSKGALPRADSAR